MVQPIRSPEDLNKLREKAKENLELRTSEKDLVIIVHMGTCGIAAGARDILKAIISELSIYGIKNVTVKQSGCAGLCDREPMITIKHKSTDTEYKYGKLDAEKVREIIQKHIISGSPIMEYLIS